MISIVSFRHIAAMRRLLVVVATMFTATLVAKADVVESPYYFTRIDVSDGLSNNHVKSIVRDHWGFVWFGTNNGLNRYDGNNIKRYIVSDEVAGSGNNNVSALFEDSQNRLWVGTDRGVYIFDSYSEKFTLFDEKATNTGEKVENWISQITADKDGNVWIIAPDQGAFRYNPVSKKMYLYRTNGGGWSYVNNPQSMCVRPNGDVWLGTNGAGLFKVDRKTGRLTQFVADKSGVSLAGKNIYTMCNYGDWILIGEHEDRLMKLNPTTKELRQVASTNVHYKLIRGLVYKNGKLIVSTQDGLYIIDEKHGTETHLSEDNRQRNGLPDNMTYTLFDDKERGIWVGTTYAGACLMTQKGLFFNTYTPDPTANSIGSRCLRDMISDKYGNIWIASEKGTLDKYDPRTHRFTNIDIPKYKGGNNRLCLCTDGDNLLTGVFKNGIDVIDTRTNAIVRHFTPSELNILPERSAFALYRDNENRMWLSSGHGVYLRSKGMKFTKITTLPDLYVQDILQDRNGDLWMATMGMGIYRYTPKTGRYVEYTVETTKNALRSNSVGSITMDHNGDLWFSTERGGISVYRFKTGKFTSYTKENGLPDDMAYKILEDDKHNLWFGTSHGLVQFNVNTGAIEVFLTHNGLPGNQYGYKSAVKSSTGTFLFGGTDGLVEFDPKQAEKSNKGRKVFITNIKMDNKELLPEEDGILKTNILHAKEIHLPYNMSNIELSVSSLNFSKSLSDQYEYMLVGVDKGWMTTQNGQNIYYSRLQSGSYTFKVRLAGSNDSVTELNILVAHPWWATIWAKLFYVLIICCLGYYIYHNVHQKQMRKFAEREERFKEAKEKELLKAKIEFFTNVTHEIRTPLTLINGSVENVLDERFDNPKVNKNLAAIGKNCKRLLNLVNQLLDFRKVDSNVRKLNIANIDLCKLLSNIVERFEPAIVRMGKMISLDIEEDAIIVPMDVEAVTKIVSNMLNNARKYSDSFIQVVVSKTNEAASVVVINDGDKIPKDKAETIFAPFEQLNEHNGTTGTGIGLTLARSLAELHKGSLILDTSSEYNKFVLTLPLHQADVVATENSEQDLQGSNAMLDVLDEGDYEYEDAGNKEYTVLLVEDNNEMMQMITEKLNDLFNIETAQNGKLALDILEHKHIDIIISDIMMPVMDGLQLTAAVKENMEINHIPIILLTAKTTLQSHIEGLKVGADAYIEKPFSFVHLITQIETLMNNRKRERANFVQKPYLPVQNNKINRAEEKFLSKASELIIKNINDSQFNVEQLAQEMCMSRSSLHRKIKEVANMTPIDFIRLIRLKKAAELMHEYGYRTTEVCDMVGINSPSYFIKLFQKQFGMTPKDYANTL